MRVTFQSYENHILPRLQNIAAQQDLAQSQLSNGQRIVLPSDDPNAMARVMNSRAEAASTRQYFQNAQSALDTSTAGFAALQQIQSIGSRSDELASLTTSVSAPEDFAAHASEVTQLIEQAVGAANAQLHGNYLLGGTQTDTPPYQVTRDAQGEIVSVAYTGNAAGASIPVSDSESVSPYTNGTENQQIADYINGLISLRTALRSGSAPAVAAARPALSTGENNILATISRSGGVQAQLQSSVSAAQSRYTDLEGLISKDADVDYAQASVRLTQAQTAYQAALQSAAKLQSKSLLDYL
jgi:flagellar hook-associated protein 3 FlgL